MVLVIRNFERENGIFS